MINTLADAVQPPGDVKVTEYVPEALTPIWLSVEPVLHRTLPVPTTVNVTIGLAQVRTVFEAVILT